MRTALVIAILLAFVFALSLTSRGCEEDTTTVRAVAPAATTFQPPTSTTTTTMPVTTTSTTARARTAPTIRPAAASRPAQVQVGNVWDRLARCESGGRWNISTGNGYFGGLQMDMQFWRSYGGPTYASRPDLASREQQIVVAERARDGGRGYHPWPACARRLGLI